MKTTVAMDESGNTQQFIAVGLVNIPGKEIPKINSILTLKQNDPKEIHTLYEKKSEGEFKYTDLRNAFRQTRLDVFDDFLKEKLRQINQLDVATYLTVFPNPKNNEERRSRLLRESEDLLHKWAHQNPEAAFSHELEIIVDQQVFPETYVFEYYNRRSRLHCELIPKRNLFDKKNTKWIPTDRENSVEIKDANSKVFKSIQLTDLLVGCAREFYALNVGEYFPLVKRLFSKERSRIQLEAYTYSARGMIDPKKW